MKKWKNLPNKSKYIILFIVLLSMFQCTFVGSIFEKADNFNVYNHPVFAEGDTLTFISENKIDSFYVSYSKVAKPEEWGFIGDYFAYEANWEPLGCMDTLCVKYEISTTPSSYYWIYTYNDLRFIGGNIIVKGMYEDEFGSTQEGIHGFELLDLYEINFVHEIEIGIHIEITTALFSESIGFVQYTKHTGEVFTISEETLEMLMAREWPVAQ